MRIRSVLVASALALGAIVVPATTAHAAADTPVQKCARQGKTKGLFLQLPFSTLCQERKGTHWRGFAYGCGPLRSGDKGYVTTERGTRISCNGWINFAHQYVTLTYL
ncbi:hypothetical protein GCM10022247_68330 [Allokutzneria multivorans]|uniref:Uncharacterized protein n=1 Tax=Allokutzneria multivorans TaxID=1142134 RepID=A0ABP7TZJ6_9PSEU